MPVSRHGSDRSELLAFAEDPQAYVSLGPHEERIDTGRALVTFTPGEHVWSTHVARVRMDAGHVRGAVKEVRRLMRRRGRSAAAWSLGPSATPGDVVDQLLGVGLTAESDEGSIILVMTAPPSERSGGFEIRAVSSFDDHLASLDVTARGFGFSPEDAEDERRRARATFDAERSGGHTARLLALDGDRAVSTGRAWFTPLGVYLGGGATLPTERRRGAMSALVAAAWDEAVGRDTPALVTHAGAMAGPALLRLGFRPVGRITHLIDTGG